MPTFPPKILIPQLLYPALWLHLFCSHPLKIMQTFSCPSLYLSFKFPLLLPGNSQVMNHVGNLRSLSYPPILTPQSCPKLCSRPPASKRWSIQILVIHPGFSQYPSYRFPFQYLETIHLGFPVNIPDKI